MIKIILMFVLINVLTACGTGKSSKVAVTAPLPEPPITGVLVKVTSYDAIGSDTNLCHSTDSSTSALTFTEISTSSGLNFSHSMPNGDGMMGMSGGIAAGDFDQDGWVDLYAIGGEGQPNLLLKNQGDGSFSDQAKFAGVDLLTRGSGPAFADLNGDGLPDLFVGSVGGASAKLYLNQGNDKFLDITASSGLVLRGNNFSASWGDYDKDGDLDLFITHWSFVSQDHYAYLWRNNGDLTFTDVSLAAGIKNVGSKDKTFTPTFTDFDNDGWQDLLLVADNNQTRVFKNNKNGTFSDVTDQDVITDNAGMGSAVGDYDNDGDLDWFVSAISYRDGVTDFGWLTPGNRFYENQGDGTFIDKTDETGVRHGFWGWGACFSDFNNDGYLDLFHVNGMEGKNIDLKFKTDPSRLFMSNRDGTFTESAVAAGIDDKGMGRGLVCFDYDQDGDVDLYIANYNQPPKLYCNQGNNNNFVNIKLIEKSLNSQALGARIYVKTGTMEQMRELRSGNNYVSQNPVVAHFGLGQASVIDEVRIVWPDSKTTSIKNIKINQFVTIER